MLPPFNIYHNRVFSYFLTLTAVDSGLSAHLDRLSSRSFPITGFN